MAGLQSHHRLRRFNQFPSGQHLATQTNNIEQMSQKQTQTYIIAPITHHMSPVQTSHTPSSIPHTFYQPPAWHLQTPRMASQKTNAITNPPERHHQTPRMTSQKTNAITKPPRTTSPNTPHGITKKQTPSQIHPNGIAKRPERHHQKQTPSQIHPNGISKRPAWHHQTPHTASTKQSGWHRQNRRRR